MFALFNETHRTGAKEGMATPIDVLGPPNQQAYSLENCGFCALFQTLVPPDKRLAP